MHAVLTVLLLYVCCPSVEKVFSATFLVTIIMLPVHLCKFHVLLDILWSDPHSACFMNFLD